MTPAPPARRLFSIGPPGFSPRRLAALCRKEVFQILRDPSSGLIAFALPMVLLFIFGYGINLDTMRVRLGLFNGDGGAASVEFAQRLAGSPYVELRASPDRAALDRLLEDGEVRGFVVLAADFSRQNDRPAVQVVTDGAEPNTANFVEAYVSGIWQQWQASLAPQRPFYQPSQSAPAARQVSIQRRLWFNPSAESRHYLIPGSITIIMTVIGAMLTALVVAREWERGTMEALLSSPVSRAELLLSKLVPYYLLGMASMAIVTASAVGVMGVPFRGSVLALFLVSTFFLLSVLGIGLVISSVTRSQFNSAQIALNVAFLPAVMLSGFIFEIASMPAPVRAVTWLLPPRYFVNALQTLFLAGDVWPILWPDMLFLAASSALFIGLAARMTRRRMD